jgi:hypothetical protein
MPTLPLRRLLVLAFVLLLIPSAMQFGKMLRIGPSVAQSTTACPAPLPPFAAVPMLAQWEANMITFGKSNGEALVARQDDSPIDPALGMVASDAIRVYHQIAAYTGDGATWAKYITAAKKVYRDRYVVPSNGAVPGFWNFATGLRLDFDRNSDTKSKTAVMLLAGNAAYAVDGVDPAYTASMSRMREVALTILSYIEDQTLGGPQRTRRALFVNQAYGHINQFVTGTWQGTPIQASPFTAALTAHALIRDWQYTADSRLLPALRALADYLWTQAWVPADQSMLYQLNPFDGSDGGRSTRGQPDLNLLIAPLYAFLFKATGDPKYRDEGDALFAAGVAKAYLEQNKQFNQNYWWSFDYVAWRSS